MQRAQAFGLLLATPATLASVLARAADPPEPYRTLDPAQDASLDDSLALEYGAPQAKAWVSLGSFYKRHRSGHNDLGVMLLLGLPLERIATPAATRAPSQGLAEGPAPQTAQPELPPQPALRVHTRLARSCVQAAWRAHGWNVESDLDRMASRSRWSSVLPEVRLRMARGWDDSFRVTSTEADPYRSQEVTGTSRWLEGRLIWRLDRALFADEEIPIERLRMQRAEARSRLAGKVLAALFDWQKALMAASDPMLSSQEHLGAVLQQAEAEAVLDVLTAGWFAQWRKETGAP
jgi:hypothetical protein